jgi:hypothetical protein
MKFNRRLVVVVLVPISLFGALILFEKVEHSLYVYATPETQSAFLQSYTPEDLAKRFSCSRYSAQSAEGLSTGAGRQFASNEKRFERYFVIRAKDWTPLMSTLRDDISSQLVLRGAQILDQTGNAREGFKFQYKSGKTLGEVNVEPLKIVDAASIAGRSGICKGEVAVELRVSVQEKWFKKEPGVIAVKMSSGPS